MALFRRTDPEPPPARPSVASEAQAAQLRGRARRRLVGAVALVLAAVIVLPMALDSEPIPVASDIAIVIPDRASAFAPPLTDNAAPPADVTPASATPASTPPAQAATPQASAATTSSATQTTTRPPAAPERAAQSPRPATATAPPRATPAANAGVSPTPAPNGAAARTDDGSRAIALLEGRAASNAGAAGNGYVLQIAAYANEADARTRRDQLVKAGVANAFVTAATVNGKTQYRLRVGPFASRPDAQAAQPRLRALGYDNGFIAPQ